MAVEVDGAFGALVDDQRVVVSWTLREARPCLGIKLRPRGGHPSLRGGRNRRIRLP
jgi:hypothetical protein